MTESREVGREPVVGKLAAAIAYIDEVVGAGRYERVEIRDEDDKTVYHYPRVMFASP